MPRIRPLPGLGDTVTGLRHYHRQWEKLMSAAGSAPPRVPTALTEVTGFGTDPGNLRMMTHLPPLLAPGAALVVAVHGCTQTASAYDAGTGWSSLADRAGFALLLPEQRRANNPHACFNWFQPEDVTRGHGEVESIRQMIAHMIAAHDIDPNRVFITGLSAGGAMTASMLATYPELFAAGAIIAGLPHGGAASVPEALDIMHQGHSAPAEMLGELVRAASPHHGPWPTVQIWHGTADRTVSAVNAQELVKQWTDVHGLAATPDVAGHFGPHAHLAWTDRRGHAKVEYYAIEGMGHGVPVVPTSDDDPESCGAAGPYMLEAGISATYRIAAAWGLVQPAISPVRPVAPKKNDFSGMIANALRSAGILHDE